MRNIRLVAVSIILSILLQPATISWAGQTIDNRRQSFFEGGRSVSDVEDSFLRSTRLLQQKQELQRLRDEVQSQARRGGGGGGTNPPSGTYPNDPYYHTTGTWGQSYGDLWGVKAIGLSDAVWSLYKGEGVTIGVVDTGVLMNHEDIAANVWTNPFEIAGNGIDDDNNGYIDDMRGWDFVDNDNNPSDLNGHGSHVAGIAAAVGNNSKGIIGVAPLADVIPVRVLDRSGSGTLQAVADGIRYAAKVGADIINLSLGAANLDSFGLSLLQSAVDFARNLGSIIVAAAGNSNADVDNFSPANLNGVIAVGATDANDDRASFSNFGDSLFISAPGVDILSLGNKNVNIGSRVSNNYYRASGTSMAAPFVAGAIALLLGQTPDASFETIKSLLQGGAADLGAAGWDPYFGYGRLNIAASLGVSSGSSSSLSGGVSGSFGTGSDSGAQSLEIGVPVSFDADHLFDERLFLKRLEEEYGLTLARIVS